MNSFATAALQRDWLCQYTGVCEGGVTPVEKREVVIAELGRYGAVVHMVWLLFCVVKTRLSEHVLLL